MLHCAVHVLHTVCFLSEITHVSETEALCCTLERHLNSLGVTVLLPTSFFSPSLIIFLALHSLHRRTTKRAGYHACLSPPARRESWHLAPLTFSKLISFSADFQQGREPKQSWKSSYSSILGTAGGNGGGLS